MTRLKAGAIYRLAYRVHNETAARVEGALKGLQIGDRNPYLSGMPKSHFEFCIPTVGKVVRASAEWFREIKYDGYRLRIEREDDRSIALGVSDFAAASLNRPLLSS
jgi:ATP-dependent DNA ligase